MPVRGCHFHSKHIFRWLSCGLPPAMVGDSAQRELEPSPGAITRAHRLYLPAWGMATSYSATPPFSPGSCMLAVAVARMNPAPASLIAVKGSSMRAASSASIRTNDAPSPLAFSCVLA